MIFCIWNRLYQIKDSRSELCLAGNHHMSNTLSIQDLPIEGKRVLIRVDFNVPLNEGQQITDDTRIQSALPTIRYVLEKGGIPILMSHLGRPEGKRVAAFSLKPCAERLAQLLKRKVIFASDCVGSDVKEIASRLKPGDLLILENLRFHPGEESPEKDPSFAKQLAEHGQLYINDAFGTAHRSHSSTTLIARYFPKKAAPGFLLQKEIQFLGKTLNHPKKPFYALIGGAKISSKIGVLKSLCSKVDGLIIGGAMAFTFLKAQGFQIGDSLYEKDYLQEALQILKKAEESSIDFLLPIDAVACKEITPTSPKQTFSLSQGIPEGYRGVDIGKNTIELFLSHLKKAKTIFWNGPMGIFEIDDFAKGTYELANGIAYMEAVTIVGGGDSVAALQKTGLAERMTHLSTGGGAALEYIEKGTLPGIDILMENFTTA